LVLAAVYGSLGWGFIAVIAVGYFNGVIRANYLGVFTTFMFDSAVLGLYIGFAMFEKKTSRSLWSGPTGRFTLFLIGWPTLLALIPVNDLLVQLVALRATAWYLPIMLIATRLNSADLTVLTRGLAVLNLVALAGGIYVYQNGVESLYPRNAITMLIYNSKDVGGNEYHRIPSIFLNSHAYGTSMLLSLPYLFGHLFGPRASVLDRGLAAAGAAAAISGILMCGARQPVVTLGIAILIAWAFTRFNPLVGLVSVAVVLAGVVVAATDERLQRAGSLENTNVVSERVEMSANASFFDLLAEYPFGAGMGSSVGTSVPYFLADRAPRQVGMENEYSRILVDQGWVGLGAWVVFLVWILSWPPALKLTSRWGLGAILMYALVLTNWATTFIGAGIMALIPGSVLLLTQMGILIRIHSSANTGTSNSTPTGVRSTSQMISSGANR
jgi:hypothetical protein